MALEFTHQVRRQTGRNSENQRFSVSPSLHPDHGEHQILSPQDKRPNAYATQVALTCAKCHDNQELTQKYNLPEKRLRTFQGSFHGVASAHGETKVANCVSWHGFHNLEIPNLALQSLLNRALNSEIPRTAQS